MILASHTVLALILLQLIFFSINTSVHGNVGKCIHFLQVVEMKTSRIDRKVLPYRQYQCLITCADFEK